MAAQARMPARTQAWGRTEAGAVSWLLGVARDHRAWMAQPLLGLAVSMALFREETILGPRLLRLTPEPFQRLGKRAQTILVVAMAVDWTVRARVLSGWLDRTESAPAQGAPDHGERRWGRGLKMFAVGVFVYQVALMVWCTWRWAGQLQTIGMRLGGMDSAMVREEGIPRGMERRELWVKVGIVVGGTRMGWDRRERGFTWAWGMLVQMVIVGMELWM
jgi:hypothetical protein